MANEEIKTGANPGYAIGQLARALSAFDTHTDSPDPGLKERTQRRIETWSKVFARMLSGALEIGSRTPVADTPAWATLEVATGGFATGELRAAGPLLPHELELLNRLDRPQSTDARAVLNGYYLSEAGLAELRELLHSCRYRIEVPEEGALLTVAWLLEKGHAERARALLDTIAPYLGKLRFYPAPSSQPLPQGTSVHVQTVAETRKSLADISERLELLAQREALRIWTPLLDQAVALFVETVEGELPSLELAADGRPRRSADGSWTLRGGWPCQRYPADWQRRAAAWLDDFKRLRKQNRLCGKPERAKENLARLHTYLARCAVDPKALTGRDVGMVRLILAHVAAARGLPGSPSCQALRAAQAQHAALPSKRELAQVLSERLRTCPQDGGLDALEPMMQPVSEAESAALGVLAQRPMHPAFRPILLRCLDASVDFLVEQRAITSGETLARVLPQLTAATSAAGIADPALRRLYGALYEAFRKRRSLLLLNLQSQVRVNELPWVAAIAEFRIESKDLRARARLVLEQLVTLALTAFPHAILPNKLLQEIRLLVERAGLSLPIVDEVAADIFMGQFSEKYLRAAQLAAQLLTGSLYETYYGFSYDQVRRIDDVQAARSGGAPTSRGFLQLCCQLAGESLDDRGGSVARNGRILEQEQILTTHNLAPLVGRLGLAQTLEAQLPELARRCFSWICRQQQIPIKDWRPQLHMVKNCAYAWRQMLFFLSLAPAEIPAFMGWAAAHLVEQRADFLARFAPIFAGLERAVRGESPDKPPRSRRFLGWAADQRWLLP